MAESSAKPLETEHRGDTAVIRLHGRITELEAHGLEQQLLEQVEQGRPKVVLDLTDVPFITSACLGALMVAHKRGRERGGYLRVACAQPLVRQVLQMTKLTRLFGLYESVEDAVAAP